MKSASARARGWARPQQAGAAQASEQRGRRKIRNQAARLDPSIDTLVLGIELPARRGRRPSIARPSSITWCRNTRSASSARQKESERKQIEANGIRAFQQTVSQGISDSYLRWRGIEATLAARAVHQHQDRDRRRRQGRPADHSRQRGRAGARGVAGRHADHATRRAATSRRRPPPDKPPVAGTTPSDKTSTPPRDDRKAPRRQHDGQKSPTAATDEAARQRAERTTKKGASTTFSGLTRGRSFRGFPGVPLGRLRQDLQGTRKIAVRKAGRGSRRDSAAARPELEMLHAERRGVTVAREGMPARPNGWRCRTATRLVGHCAQWLCDRQG